jgi:hypothetical protein
MHELYRLAYVAENNKIPIRILAHPRVPQDITETSSVNCYIHVAG